MLASIALNYALVADASEIEPARREKIESWIGQLARAWLEAPDYGFDSPNNHVNWGALALMARAPPQDRTSSTGRRTRATGLAQIDADGSAPLELSRGDRGITYQIFALEPLVVAAEIGLANGIDLYAERGGALQRLASLPAMPCSIRDRRAADRRRAGLDGQGRIPARSAGLGLGAGLLRALSRPDLARRPVVAARCDFTQLWLGDMALRFGPERREPGPVGSETSLPRRRRSGGAVQRSRRPECKRVVHRSGIALLSSAASLSAWNSR